MSGAEMTGRPVSRAAGGSGNGNGVWPPGSLLGGLPPAARQRLLSLGTKTQYPGSGRVLIREGEASSLVYLLLAGVVKVSGSTGKSDALLAIRVGGDVVGELSALDDRPRSATVTTAGPVIARVIGQREFISFLSREPGAALAISRGVTDKLRSATARRVDFAAYDVATRFARVLLELAIRYGYPTEGGMVIRCPLTQSELAALIGVAEPTIQRVLRQLRSDGIVASGYRETTVLDMAGLRERALPG